MLLEDYFNFLQETLYNKTENLQFVYRFNVKAFWNHHGQEKIIATPRLTQTTTEKTLKNSTKCYGDI